MGQLAGPLFLLALTLMAFLSAVAGLEVCLVAAQHLLGRRLGRGQLLLALGLIEAALMWPSAHSTVLIGQLDLIFGSGMQIFGATVALVALVWGLGTQVMTKQILPAAGGMLTRLMGLWLRWVVPTAFATILLLYLHDQLFSVS